MSEYDEQLSAARYRAERDLARQECERLRGEVDKLVNDLIHAEYDADEHAWVRAHGGLDALRALVDGPQVTMSAYDLLSEEERETLRWVGKQGGLNDVKNLHNNGELPLRDLCDILGLDRVDTSWMDAFKELEKRLMPGGYEWPRYEDGEPVRAMDEFADCFGKTHKAEAIGLMSATYVLQDSDSQTGELRTIAQRPYGTPAVRAVLAADGEPLEAGQTVWHIDTGDEFYVSCFSSRTVNVSDKKGGGLQLLPSQLTHQRPVLDAEGNRIEPAMDVWWICEGDERGIHAERLHVDGIDDDGYVECSPYNGGTSVCLDSAELYVKKPVLDANGVPIKVGDTVWHKGTGEKYRVFRFSDEENRVWGESDLGSFFLDCSMLTHTKPEPPESWERIEEDKGLDPFDYCKKVGHKLWTFDNAEEFKASDLVRRCRALAERERGE